MALRPPKILIAPLDWGLGHANRCIPVIKLFLSAGCEVIIASAGDQKKLLRSEFPALRILDLPGYGVHFSTKKGKTLLKIAAQTPKILIQIKRENRWLNNILRTEQPDLVISDNRFGFHTDKIPCIFITHQVKIKTGLGAPADRFVSWYNRKMISRFTECWIPDVPDAPGLAGELSHPPLFPSIPYRYIGHPTRFGAGLEMKPSIDLLIILSGPEPQRSLLENALIEQLFYYEKKVVMFRGLPSAAELPVLPVNVEVHNHLPTPEFYAFFCRAELVICRSGYSTLMDLMKLQKKAIVIPTPGQAEQEYLAESLAERRMVYAVSQSDINLVKDIPAARTFNFVFTEPDSGSLLSEAVNNALTRINARAGI